MKKDIFIDNNIANKFANPPNQSFKDLINWLLYNDKKNPLNNAYLVVSNYIRKEYFNSNQNCCSRLSIVTIYYEMQKQGRLIEFSNQAINEFIKKKIKNNGSLVLLCNSADHFHFYPIFFSDRKMVLTEDRNFTYDLLNFPKFNKGVCVKNDPEILDYKH